jgi:hypothetical protein
MEINETKKLLYNKGNGHHIEKLAQKWEKIIASYKSINTIICMELIKLNSPQIRYPMKKWADELNRAFQRKKSK